MEISHIFVLICGVTLCGSQEETVFHCSAKPGCQITHCDPIPLGLGKLGFNFEEDIKAREFPITCQGKSTSQGQANLSPIVYSNLQDITHIKQDIKEQADERKNENEQVEKIKKELLDLKKENADLKNDIKEFTDERKSEKQQVEKMNRELFQMRKENAELNKVLGQLERKVTIIENNQRRQVSTRPVVRPTVGTLRRTITRPIRLASTTKNTGNPPCDYEKNSICYWTEVRTSRSINYYEATKLCKSKNSILAVIPSDEVYEKIYSALRSKMSGSGSKFFWIELQINPITGKTSPADAYARWHPSGRHVGGARSGSTHVYLAVNSKPEFRNQGMVNYLPTAVQNGMVCQYKAA